MSKRVIQGKFRVYWNRAQDFPKVWSIDDGNISNEVNVERVFFIVSKGA
jgi:hypothetical protein